MVKFEHIASVNPVIHWTVNGRCVPSSHKVNIDNTMKRKKGIWQLSLVVASENDDIVITLSDNGVGKESEILENLLLEDPFLPKTARQPIGVSATHKRLQLLFGEQYGLKYSSKIGEGTTVYVRIPKEA